MFRNSVQMLSSRRFITRLNASVQLRRRGSPDSLSQNPFLASSPASPPALWSALALIFALFSFTVLTFPLPAFAEESYRFTVTRKGDEVGQCQIAFSKQGELTKVTYRMNIVVRLLGIPVYRLDSHQIALFNGKAELLSARTKANIDGAEHQVSVDATGDSYRIVHNGKERTVERSALVSTTLNPVFHRPKGGAWLDLTDGQILPYSVQERDGHIELGRPDGRDLLYSDQSGVITRIESFVSKGSLIMTRTTSNTAPLPPLVTEEPRVPSL